MTLPPVPDAPKGSEVLALEKRDAVLQEQITAIDKRVTTLETAAPKAPSPVAVITIDTATEGQLAKLTPGQAAVLRGPVDDFVVVVS